MAPSATVRRRRTRVRRSLILAVAAVVGVATAGCGGERPSFADGPDATLPSSTTAAQPRPGTVLATDWADGFCDSFRAWQDDATTAGSTLAADLADTSDPATVRQALVDLLDHIATGTEALAGDIRAGTVPDVDGGPALVEAIAVRFDDLAATFAGYRDRAQQIDVVDPDRFQTGVSEVTSEMSEGQDRIAQSFEEIDQDFPDRDLQQALRRSCEPG